MPKPCPKCHKPNSDNAIQCWNCEYKFSAGTSSSNPPSTVPSTPPKSEAKTPIILILILIGVAGLAWVAQPSYRFLEFPIFPTVLFLISIAVIIVIYNWASTANPQNKNIYTWVSGSLIFAVIFIFAFFIYTETAYAEQAIKFVNKGTKAISKTLTDFNKQISFYTCTLSNPINPLECASEESNIEKDETLYNTLELTYGIKTKLGGKVIPPQTPKGAKPYTLDFTLSNTNTPSEEFDYSIDVTEIGALAADKISKNAFTLPGTVNDLPQTLSPEESYSFEAVFSSLPQCLTYSEDLKGKLYFYVDVTTEQAVGSSTRFMLVTNRQDFQDEVNAFYKGLKIRPGPGPIDVYAFTKPFVIETDKNKPIDIEIKIENTKTEGIATIESLTLIHTVEETNPFTTITCPSPEYVDPYISSAKSISCPGGESGNCIEITFNQLQIEEDSVYDITCSAEINSKLKLESEKTDDIAVEARYRYKQTFGPDSAVAFCTLQTPGEIGPTTAYCAGTVKPCGGLNEADCIKQDGCRWDKVDVGFECVGIPTPCDEITDPIQCIKKYGCTLSIRPVGQALSLTQVYDTYKSDIDYAISTEGLPNPFLTRDEMAAIITTIIKKESGGNINAASGDSFGLMQVRFVGSSPCPDIVSTKNDLFNPRKNIQCGTRIFKNKLAFMRNLCPASTFNQNIIELTAAAYNNGEGAIECDINKVGSCQWSDIGKVEILAECNRNYGKSLCADPAKWCSGTNYDCYECKGDITKRYVTDFYSLYLQALNYIKGPKEPQAPRV